MPAEILTEVRDHILIITINRPEARNAMNKPMAVQLEAAVDRLEADPDLRLGILTGAGGYFCAGQDLKEAATGSSSRTDKRGGFGITRLPPTKPMIAAVEGPVLAGGLELALSCDLLVASSAATFGLPEVKRSLTAIGGGLIRLPRRIPYQIAMELALTGDAQSAERMYQVGLVNRLTEPGAALTGALALAAQIMANAPLAVQASKQIISRNIYEGWSDHHGWDLQTPIADPVSRSADRKEGLAAFAEKRPPNWQGK